jgi:hypothetical protein
MITSLSSSTFCLLILPFCLQELSEVKGTEPFAFARILI